MKSENYLSLETTTDGSITFFSEEFEEAFHSRFGAKQEAELKFVLPSQLLEKARHQNTISFVDICYGLGYNTASALSAIWEVNPNCKIQCWALESDQNVINLALKHHLLDSWGEEIVNLLTLLSHTHHVNTPHFEGHLLIGDARKTIQEIIKKKIQAEAIFLDPFSPPKCPQLWTVEFLGLVSQCLANKGRLMTYSCASSIRTALRMAGLNISPSVAVGRRSPGTIASFETDLAPLSLQELEHLQTRASIPYRDPFLNESAEIILKRREEEQKKSDLEPTYQWKKRWTKRYSHA